MAKELWKGNEAIAEAAIRAGCKYFFGYPITLRMRSPNICPCICPRSAVASCRLRAKSPLST